MLMIDTTTNSEFHLPLLSQMRYTSLGNPTGIPGDGLVIGAPSLYLILSQKSVEVKR